MNLPNASYNPSLIRHQGHLLLSCRDHIGDWRTALHLAELNEDFSVKSVSRIEMPPSLVNDSVEDARLFNYHQELWMSWTCSRNVGGLFRCAMAFGNLISEDGVWKVDRYCFPTYGKNDWTALEKNWTAIELDGALWSYYDTRDNVQTFIRLQGEVVAESVKSRSFPWAYGPIHGGAILRSQSGTLLHFFNSRLGHLANGSHRYSIGVAELSANPPFDMLRISQRPIIGGEEGCNLDGCRWFKANVVFACGAIREPGGILLSYGWNDSKCRLMKLKEEELFQ